MVATFGCLLLILFVVIVRGARKVLARVRARLHHVALRVPLARADVEEVGTAPPAAHSLDVLGVAADREQGRCTADPAAAEGDGLDIRVAA